MAEAPATHRDDVLVTVDAVCSRPTAWPVAAWVKRHPALQDGIRAHAGAVLAGIEDRHLRTTLSVDLLTRTWTTPLNTVEAVRPRATRSGAVSGLIAALSIGARQAFQGARVGIEMLELDDGEMVEAEFVDEEATIDPTATRSPSGRRSLS